MVSVTIRWDAAALARAKSNEPSVTKSVSLLEKKRTVVESKSEQLWNELKFVAKMTLEMQQSTGASKPLHVRRQNARDMKKKIRAANQLVL